MKRDGHGLAISTGFLCALLGAQMACAASVPDFSEGAAISPEGRPNPYQLSDSEFETVRTQGRLHAINYPVTVTGILPPYAPFANVVTKVLGSSGLDQVFKWVGLQNFPAESDQGVYSVPFPNGVRPSYRMGLTFIQTAQGTGFTFSCVACHAAGLFGKTVVGMTNRFPHANETFLDAKEGLQYGAPAFTPFIFSMLSEATPGEAAMFQTVQSNIHAVGVVKPRALGLDTSLAQVALSMARRNQDAYATRSSYYEKNPRQEPLETHAADSKPSVWWNVKYKNRWLSDGSVVSGNPIYTNILWNEIGRGADLKSIESWLSDNSQAIEELTTAVFSSEAPRISDFFPESKLNVQSAQRGQKVFARNCAECHGTYDKAWDLPGGGSLPFAERIATTQVHYHAGTPVIDVGTDPSRYQGMISLEQDLNPLAISINNGIKITHQIGYVPPPLVGIWARWPYFHNNSAPSLCAVLTRGSSRQTTYTAVEANDPDQDFDFPCNGYPLGNRSDGVEYDTRKAGMSNSGHDEGIFLNNGQEILSAQEKSDLIAFLQTL